jgi:hypothetical protein
MSIPLLLIKLLKMIIVELYRGGSKFLLMVLSPVFLVNLSQLPKFIRELLKVLANLLLQHLRILFVENLHFNSL